MLWVLWPSHQWDRRKFERICLWIENRSPIFLSSTIHHQFSIMAFRMSKLPIRSSSATYWRPSFYLSDRVFKALPKSSTLLTRSIATNVIRRSPTASKPVSAQVSLEPLDFDRVDRDLLSSTPVYKVTAEDEEALRPIYLDSSSTTPTDPRVLDAMLPFMTNQFGNPHSKTHAYGWETETAVEVGRKVLSFFLSPLSLLSFLPRRRSR